MQPFLYFRQNPIPVLLWGLLICLIPSIVITKLVNWINRKKNKLLFKRG